MKTIIKLIAITIIVFSISLIFATSIYATTGKITASSLRLREEPSTESDVITQISENEEVEILDESGDWYHIKYGNSEGYVSSEYVEVTEEQTNNQNEEPKNNEKRQMQKGTQIYIIPVYTSSVLVTLDETSEITVLRVMNKWTYVQYGDITGWIKNSSFNTQKNTSQETETNETTKQTVGYINVDSAFLRKEATQNSEEIGNLTLNEKVQILATQGDWYQVRAQGTTGYVFKELVSSSKTSTSRGSIISRSRLSVQSLEEKINQENREEKAKTILEDEIVKTAYVNGSVVNVREKATTESKVLTTVSKRTPINVISTEGNWYKIKINNKIGYISKDYVVDSLSQVKKDEPIKNVVIKPSKTTNAKGKDIAEYAKKFVGYKYVYGGSGPTTFDCSGFTMYVFKQFGKSLPHSAASQANYGKKVSTTDIQIGDLLVFYDRAKTSIGHVGIYIGNNKFVHAANSTRGVTTDSIYSSYYKTRLIEVRRLV